jgi:hypothetical protein
MLADDPFIRDVSPPLTRDKLAPLDARCGLVQFRQLLSDAEFLSLSDFMRGYPSVALRAYGGYDGSIRDLEFLRFFPDTRRFSADALYGQLESLDGLRHLRDDLVSLTIGRTRRQLPLSILGRFTELKRLYLEGQTRGIEVLSGLSTLEDLTLRSITLPDLTLLTPLTNLRALDLKLGGTNNVHLLSSVGRLEYLELWMVRGFEDLSPVEGLHGLRYLFLQGLKNVRTLPRLTHATALRGVHLETMKGLTDLSPLCHAPALEQLALVDMRHLSPIDLACLVGHRTLEAVIIGLGSKTKNDAARDMLRLPDFQRTREDWRPGVV